MRLVLRLLLILITIMTLNSYKKNKPFRAVAEFEPQSSVLVGWNRDPFANQDQTLNNDFVSLNIIKAIEGHGDIIIHCFDDSVKYRAENLLKKANVKTSEIDFWIYPSDLLFPRDYAADIVKNEDGEKRLAGFNFDFYGTYPLDYEIDGIYKKFAKLHAKRLGITKSSFSTIISEGGNREFNGEGVMMAIEETEVKKRNPRKNKKQIEDEFKRQFGVQKIIWLPQATYDDEHMYSAKIPDENGNFIAYRSASANGHIDEMCRFTDVNTILIAHISEEEAKNSILAQLNKERLDKAFSILRNATDINGKPFRIIKMPVPEPIYITVQSGDPVFENYISIAEVYNHKLMDGTPFPINKMKVLPALSYCNFLIFNDIVLCQEYWRMGLPEVVKKKDKEAFEILKNLFPLKKVIPINTFTLNLYGGGIHCNTKNVTK